MNKQRLFKEECIDQSFVHEIVYEEPLARDEEEESLATASEVLYMPLEARQLASINTAQVSPTDLPVQ